MRLGKADIRMAELLEKARQDRDVLAVVLFGSSARGDDGPDSDVDICLVLQPRDYNDLELSHKKLEYLGPFGAPSLDIHVYQQLPLYIKKRILKEGEVLFCSDDRALYDLAFRTIQDFEDFRRIYDGYLEEVARG